MFKGDYSFYEVESEHYYPIGTQIDFSGRKLTALSLTGEWKEGTMRFSYEFGLPHLYAAEKYYNKSLIGSALMGTVIETENEMVKVVFDINPKEEKIKKMYPFTPVMGNLFYCMPEPGEKVFVLFQNQKEAEGIAAEAFRNNDIFQCQNVSSHSDRYFTTSKGKEMKLVSGSMGMDTHTGNSIAIEDEKGITFEGKQISLEANGKIVISGEQVSAFAPLQVTLLKGKRGGGSINICQDFNTSGPIQFQAQAIPYAGEEPLRAEEQVPERGTERQALGMIPTGKSEDLSVHMALGMLVSAQKGENYGK